MAQKGKWRLVLNVTAPYVPITTDGKEPDLKPAADAIVDALSVAIRKARRAAAKDAASEDDGFLPKKRRGAKSDEIHDAHLREVQEFCSRLNKIDEGLDIKVSAHGWCYILEEDGLAKGDFKACERLINECRKNGALPYDFTAEDERRSAAGVERIDDPDPETEARDSLEKLRRHHETYRP